MACCFPHATSWFRNLTVFRGRLWTAVHWRDSSLHRTNCNIVKKALKASKTQCASFTPPQSRASVTCSASLESTPCSPTPDHCQTLPIILFAFRACLNIVWPPLTLGIYTLIIHFTPWKSLEARLEPPPPKSLFDVTTWSWNFLNLGHSPTMSEGPVRLVGEDEWQLGNQSSWCGSVFKPLVVFCRQNFIALGRIFFF